MKVLILGAGITGVTTAYTLAERGHEVKVIDPSITDGAPTLDTSAAFANGGQLSVSHAEPWANPGTPMKLLKWFGQPDAPLLFNWGLDLKQWAWCLRFARECLPSRTARNIKRIVELGLYSQTELKRIRAKHDLVYDHLERGILHFYTQSSELEAAVRPAELMAQHGCKIKMLSREDCLSIEPALALMERGPNPTRVVGGSFASADESGDAHKFGLALGQITKEMGVKFESGAPNVPIIGLLKLVKAYDQVVLCAGAWSTSLVPELRLPIIPVKGYSITLDVANPTLAPTVSLTDDEKKLVFSRFGDRLRIAGTAELIGSVPPEPINGAYQLNLTRIWPLIYRATQLFPGAFESNSAFDIFTSNDIKMWSGLRPTTPSNVPFIYRPTPKLVVNTGHGTLGWTHACGSARLAADLVEGRPTDLEPYEG